MDTLKLEKLKEKEKERYEKALVDGKKGLQRKTKRKA